jgi:hypothetical protein
MRWAAGALVVALLTGATTLPAKAIVVEQCSVVAVEMLDDVNSTEARPGDFFRFETINAVTTGAQVVIPQRTIGYGIVIIAVPAGRGGRPGTLVLEPRYLVLPNGHHVGVVLNHNSGSLASSGASNSAPVYLGAIPLPGIGAAVQLFNYFHSGKNVQVKRGTQFSVFPSDEPSVERCQDHPIL